MKATVVLYFHGGDFTQLLYVEADRLKDALLRALEQLGFMEEAQDQILSGVNPHQALTERRCRLIAVFPDHIEKVHCWPERAE